MRHKIMYYMTYKKQILTVRRNCISSSPPSPPSAMALEESALLRLIASTVSSLRSVRLLSYQY